MKSLMSGRLVLLLAATVLLVAPGSGVGGFVNFETPQVHPVDLSPDGKYLAVCNTADNRVELFDARFGNALPLGSIRVGYDPVSVRFRTNTELWVVNQISDSVSIVDVGTWAVTATLMTADEPADVVFAGVVEKAYVSCSQADVVQVFDPASLGTAPTEIAIMGEEPRALAVSADGTEVLAAVFESGNRSTVLGGGLAMGGGSPPNVVSDPAGPYGGVNPPPNSLGTFHPPIAGGLPTPPVVGLIVKKNGSGQWVDDNGGDWTTLVGGTSAALSGRPVGWDVLDNDVAIIDTATSGVSYAGGLMNACMALAVNPNTGDVTVVGTDGTNEIRFEPNINGTFLRVNAGRFNPGTPGTVTVVDLNTHLTYATSSVLQSERDKSLGDPRGIVWNAAGTKAYVTGMGSNNVIVIDAAGARTVSGATIEVGEGPTGVAIDETNGRLYVLNRFEGTVSVVNLATEAEVAKVSFFDPTPDVIKTGRPHLYDTHATSGLGHVSCASCHIDSRTDRLGWDLGDPTGGLLTIVDATLGGVTPGAGEVVINDTAGLGGLVGGGVAANFHPMKGPMTTQTLQDIIGKEPHHWRGDRQGIEQFADAFMFLLGDDAVFGAGKMTEFENYLATIHFPPNPFRGLDNLLPTNLPLPGHYATGDFALAEGAPLPNGDARRALTQVYRPLVRQIDTVTCITCHVLPAGLGTDSLNTGFDLFPVPGATWSPVPVGAMGERHHMVVGVDGSTQEAIKVPHLRNMYDKAGMITSPNPAAGGAAHVSRAGFGFLHDGTVDSLARFFGEPVFNFNTDQEIADMVALMLSFAGSDFDNAAYGYAADPLEPPVTGTQDAHAAVGQEVTLTSASMATPEYTRLTTLLGLADAGVVDVVGHGVISGVLRGAFYAGGNVFHLDEAGVMQSTAVFLSGATVGTPRTFTVVPAGCGERFGLDRDGDGLRDYDEIRDLFPDAPGHQNPFNPRLADGSGDDGATAPDGMDDGENDFDGDGTDNETELGAGTNPADGLETLVPFEVALAEAGGLVTATVSWTGAPEGVYQVQYSDDLVVWVDSPTGQLIAPGLGGAMQWVDGGPPATTSAPGVERRRYYRVVRIL
ncbi:MAG: beta-propeller fold lactonase family protein [Verrucomicrobiota bacterium]